MVQFDLPLHVHLSLVHMADASSYSKKQCLVDGPTCSTLAKCWARGVLATSPISAPMERFLGISQNETTKTTTPAVATAL